MNAPTPKREALAAIRTDLERMAAMTGETPDSYGCVAFLEDALARQPVPSSSGAGLPSLAGTMIGNMLFNLRQPQSRFERDEVVRCLEHIEQALKRECPAPDTRADKARIAELEGALKPFATWAQALAIKFSDHEDDVIAGGYGTDALVTFGDLRRAAALLDKMEDGDAD
jgi:hypothetical protein